MLFGNVTIHGLPHVYSTGGALHFLKSFGEVSQNIPYFFGYKTEFFPSKTIPKI